MRHVHRAGPRTGTPGRWKVRAWVPAATQAHPAAASPPPAGWAAPAVPPARCAVRPALAPPQGTTWPPRSAAAGAAPPGGPTAGPAGARCSSSDSPSATQTRRRSRRTIRVARLGDTVCLRAFILPPSVSFIRPSPSRRVAPSWACPCPSFHLYHLGAPYPSRLLRLQSV